jgi:hypothetical protein
VKKDLDLSPEVCWADSCLFPIPQLKHVTRGFARITAPGSEALEPKRTRGIKVVEPTVRASIREQVGGRLTVCVEAWALDTLRGGTVTGCRILCMLIFGILIIAASRWWRASIREQVGGRLTLYGRYDDEIK